MINRYLANELELYSVEDCLSKLNQPLSSPGNMRMVAGIG